MKSNGMKSKRCARPIFAFGNSDSDMQMIEYTMAGEGWIIVDMKKDWKQIFPPK